MIAGSARRSGVPARATAGASRWVPFLGEGGIAGADARACRGRAFYCRRLRGCFEKRGHLRGARPLPGWLLLLEDAGLEDERATGDLVDRTNLAGVDLVPIHVHPGRVGVLDGHSPALKVEGGVLRFHRRIVQPEIGGVRASERVCPRDEHLGPDEKAVPQNHHLKDCRPAAQITLL